MARGAGQVAKRAFVTVLLALAAAYGVSATVTWRKVHSSRTRVCPCCDGAVLCVNTNCIFLSLFDS